MASRCGRLIAAFVIAWTATGPLATGQSFDLTGRWDCNDGGTYFTRQVGNRIWWVGLSADDGASFTNVFEGRISGNIISGTWADVPRGALRNSGELQLRIESPNRLSGGGAAFGGTVWTRTGTAGPAPTVGPTPTPTPTTAVDINGDWLDSNGYSFTVRQNGPMLAIAGPAGWAPASGSFTSPNAFTITWPGRGTFSATAGSNQVTWNNGVTWRRGGSGGAGGFGPAPTVGTGAAGGICENPRTQATMDEWLARAIPPQPAGSALRYESWGRLVGRSLTANVTVSGPPDTRLSRCEWLWNLAPQLRSANGLGTLKEYVESRR